MDGRSVGAKLGEKVVGDLEGYCVETTDGESLGVTDGILLGEILGRNDGDVVVGIVVDGCGVGLCDGRPEGRLQPNKQTNKRQTNKQIWVKVQSL